MASILSSQASSQPKLNYDDEKHHVRMFVLKRKVRKELKKLGQLGEPLDN